MARGPDWLLGFGFQVKDKKILKFLGDVEDKFKGLSKSMKDFNKSSTKGAGGLDMSGLAKTFKATGRGSITAGMIGLEKSVSDIVHRVDVGLHRVAESGRDISVGLQKSLEDLFVDIEKGSFKSATHLEQIPDMLLKIPGLTKASEQSLNELFTGLQSGKSTYTDMLATFKKIRKELSKTISDSSGYDIVTDKAKSASKAFADFASLLKPTSTDEILKGASEGLSMMLMPLAEKGMKKFDDWRDKRKKSKADAQAFDTQQLKELNAELGKLAARTNALGDLGTLGDPKYVVKTRALITAFTRRMFPAATKLGKLFARVPLANRLFGKKRDLVAQHVGLRQLNRDVSELENFADFKKDANAPDLSFEKFQGVLKDNALELEMAAVTAGESYFNGLKKAAEKSDAAEALSPDKEKVSAQAEELAKVVAQAVSPDAIAKEVEKMSPGKGISGPMADLFEQSEQELPTIFYAIERSIADLWATLKDSRAIEAAMTGLTGLKDKLSDVMVHGILPMKTSMEESMLAMKHHVADFGEYFADWVSGEYSYTFDRFRERINRSARTFMNLKTKADSAFAETLKSKELFVEEFEANFKKLSEKVGGHVGKISVVTEEEFRQLESKMQASYSHMETLSRTGAAQQASAIVHGFDKLDQGLKNTQKSTVANLIERSGALKKAVGLSPSPALAKLGPALARAGAGASGGAAGGAGAAEGLSMKEALVNFFKQKLEDKAREKLTSHSSDRIGQMASGTRAEREERPPAAKESSSASTNQVLQEAMRHMTDKLISQLTKTLSAAAKPAAASTITGKLKINSDEMKRVFSGSLKNEGGLMGGAR